jgi:hypothetical protein
VKKVSELNACALVTTFSTFAAILLSGGIMWWIDAATIRALREALEESIAENAKLKVAMAAAEMTGEAQKVCKLTLASLNMAFPEK